MTRADLRPIPADRELMRSIGQAPGAHSQKSPTTETSVACGAQTRNTAPATRAFFAGCAPIKS